MINDASIDLAGFVVSEPSFKTPCYRHIDREAAGRLHRTPLNRETGEWGDGPTSFVTVLCWRALADNVAMCLRKGEPVLVRGRLRVREYEGKDGSRGTETEIDASSVGHDLSRGVAHFSRTRRAPGETGGGERGGPGRRPGSGRRRAGPDDRPRRAPGLPVGAAGEETTGDAGESAADGDGRDGNGAGGGVLDDGAVAEFADSER